LRGEARVGVLDFFLLAIDVILEFIEDDTKDLASTLSIMSVHTQSFWKCPIKDASSSKIVKEFKEVGLKLKVITDFSTVF